MQLCHRVAVATLASFAALQTLAPAGAAEVLLFEDFEAAPFAYDTSVPEFNDGFGDFFTRTNGSDLPSNIDYRSVPSGTHFFAAMDLDGESPSATQMITFEGINISGHANLQFASFFAEDDEDNAEHLDPEDAVLVQYRIDAGDYTDLFAFVTSNIRTSSGSTGGEFKVDSNLDGVGDGIVITDTFQQVTAAIPGGGNVLDVRFIITLNSSHEDIAIDSISVTGEPALPLPEPTGLLGLVALGLCSMRRRRRGNSPI